MALTDRRKLGNTGEDIACRYLERKGYRIIERNHLRAWGEIDIVCTKCTVYHFVEVKSISREKGSRATSVNMSAEDHIHPAKLKKVARTVEVYMSNIQGSPDYQVDVLTVELDFSTRKASCRLYEQVL